VSGRQIRALLWLRWRLTRNAWAKSGGLGAVLAVMLGLGGAVLAAFGFGGGLLGGYLGLHGGSPAAVMWTWLGLTVAFLFVWMLGSLVDLQRSEVIDLPRLLHLPIALGSAFAINYLASLMGVTIALFAPAMLGLALGLALDRGPAMLLLVPLSMGLLFMVTAWTYLLQGWIATWVQNPRRRRALIAGIGLSVALVGQLPNLVIQVVLHPAPQADAEIFDVPGFACGAKTCRADQACDHPCCGGSPESCGGQQSSDRTYAPGLMLDDDGSDVCPQGPCVLPPPSCVDARAHIRQLKRSQVTQKQQERFVGKLLLAEEIAPPLWVAGGAGGLAEGDPLVALLGSFGFAALGALGLLRGYRSTLRFYTKGDGSARAAPAQPPAADAATSGKRRLVERRVPGVHDQTSAVAVATLQSMLRAPEIMMGLGFVFVMILVMLVMFGLMFRHSIELGAHFGPLVVAGVISMFNLTPAQLMANQFGQDRDAFRALLLAPIARRRLLLGKNLAMLMLGAPPCAAVLVATALWLHLPPLAAVAAVLQMATMLLIAAMVGNLLSILLPYRIQPGGMKATKVPPGALLAVFGMMFGLPILYFPAFAGPLSVLLGHHAHWRHPVLVDFAISLAAAAAAVGGYRASLAPLGRLLQRRETMIVARVTADHE
jgi:ABC-2 type transport system permease protein